VIEFQNDKQGWLDAAGEHTTIDFTGFPEGTWITEQYAYLGTHFVDGADLIQETEIGYPQDGWGLIGFDEIRVTFDEPIYSIGADFPGGARFDLYWQGVPIHFSPFFGGSGPGQFGGLVSDEPFDEVRIWDIDLAVFVDNLYFGPPIPAPGSIVGVAALALLARRRQRT
jgi:hypothetical protein